MSYPAHTMNPVDTMDTMKMDTVGLSTMKFRCLPSQFRCRDCHFQGSANQLLQTGRRQGTVPHLCQAHQSNAGWLPKFLVYPWVPFGISVISTVLLAISHELPPLGAYAWWWVVGVIMYFIDLCASYVLSPCQATVAECSPYCSARLNLHI